MFVKRDNPKYTFANSVCPQKSGAESPQFFKVHDV